MDPYQDITVDQYQKNIINVSSIEPFSSEDISLGGEFKTPFGKLPKAAVMGNKVHILDLFWILARNFMEMSG